MRGVRNFLTAAAFAAGFACCAFDHPVYVGGGGGMLLPGNGNSFTRAAEANVRLGFYSSDFLAWEVGGLCAPGVSSHAGHGTLSGVSAGGLFHFSGIEAFDKLFGCERFDPFVTFGGAMQFGAHHAFAHDSHRTAAGPYAGFGAFYHLTENLDLCGEARATTTCDSPCGMMYSVVFGIRWSFGGGDE